MYKITLYDQNCNPICDRTTFWFVDNLEDFESNWLKAQKKIDVKTVERYYRSKLGEIVTDYYTDDPELNIVQKVDTEVIGNKEFTYHDKIIVLRNVYQCETEVEFDQLDIKLRILKCNDKYILVGQYTGYGCKRIDLCWNRWYQKETKYKQMGFYGNPIAKYVARDINWDDWDKDDRYKDFYTDDKEFYKHEKIETFVWLPIKEVSADYKLTELTPKELAVLMRDIVGEAG